MEHRAYPRIPLRVEARLSGEGGERPCVVRDFCLGGVFLTFLGGEAATAVAAGASVRLLFTAPDARPWAVAARVARVAVEGVGLAFSDPDPAALIALQAAGAAAHRAPPPARGTGSPGVLEACARLAAEHLAAHVRTFLNAVDDALVDAASAAPDLYQTRYFDALNGLRGHKGAVLEAFSREVPNTILRLGSFTLEPDRDREPAPDASLSLVDQDEFEDFLALSEMAVRAEDRLTGSLGELERRFARLAERSIDASNDPLGPAALCHALMVGLTGFTGHRAALDVIYQSFETQVLGTLAPLYQALNRELEAAGIAPREEERPHVPRNPLPSRAGPPAGGGNMPPQGAAAESEVVEENGLARERPLRKVGMAAATAGAGAEPEGSGTEAPFPSIRPSAAVTRGHDGVMPPGEAGTPPGDVIRAAYATAQKLLSLQHQLTGDGVFPAAGASSPGGESAQAYAHHDVARALFRLQHSGVEVPDSADALEAHLIHTLRKEHPEERAAGLAGADREGVRFIAGVIETLLSDPVVAGAVRARIRRLRLPLHRVAFEDGDFLTSEDHPARQVLERLARIDADEGDPLLAQRVDPLVERIVAEREDLPRAFADVIPELDEVLAEQQAAYRDNVARLSQECEVRQRFIRERRARETDSQRAVATQAGENREALLEWQEWLARVDRLEPEDTVVLERDGERPRRARLAWVGEDRDAYVFVDGRGQQVANLTPRELAMQLRRGSAEIQSREGPPLMEHAVMEMLHGLHDGLRREATRDPVSGLPNAREFRRALEDALAAVVRERSRHALCHLNLLDLREVRRHHGNQAANELIRLAAVAVQDVAGAGAAVGDLGGGAFGVLLHGTDLVQARAVAEGLTAPARDEALEWDGSEIPVRLEVGVVAVDATTASAEAALGAARAAGRRAQGGVHVEEDQGEAAQPRRRAMSDWVPELNRTLREDRMQLRIQKVAPLSGDSGHTPFYELFLGLRDEAGRPIAPQDFLQAAEYYEQLVKLDRWVIRNALRWLQEHPEQWVSAAGYAVNLSPQSLADGSMGDYVTERLMASEVPPGKLWFEVPHSHTMGALSNAERFIHTVNGLGCRFALHRFGQGDGQFGFLKDLPVEFVKIDGEFVKNMAINASDLAVVRSVNEIAHMMGKKTVAEFVESEAVLVRLRDMGVDYAQGFYVERPRYIEALGQGAVSSPE